VSTPELLAILLEEHNYLLYTDITMLSDILSTVLHGGGVPVGSHGRPTSFAVDVAVVGGY
jgi:hypothetical protein